MSGTPVARNWWVLVPSIVTLGNAGCGFAAIVLMSRLRIDPVSGGYDNPHLLVMAGWLLLSGFVCDMFDGLLARLLKVQSAFGAELDSLADVISFGVAPALAVTALTRTAPELWLTTAGWLCAGALLAGAIVRLARFNVENENEEGGHLYFKGLPSPSAANAIASLLLLEGALRRDPWLQSFVGTDTAHRLADGIVGFTPMIALAIAGLMVSTFRYADLPKHYLRRMQPAWHLAALTITAVLLGPPLAFALFFVGYALHRPIVATTLRLLGRRPNG